MELKSVIIVELKSMDNYVGPPKNTNSGLGGTMPSYTHPSYTHHHFSNYTNNINSNYESFGEVKIDSKLEKSDSFMCRFDNLVKHYQILDTEKIFTNNNYLEIYLTIDNFLIKKLETELHEAEMIEMVQSPSSRMNNLNSNRFTYTEMLDEVTSNFRKDIISGKIEINFTGFDRKNKIDSILNSSEKESTESED